MAFPVVGGLRSIEFGNPGESRRQLTDLVLYGGKRATAGMLSEYAAEGEPVETVGERLVVLDDLGRKAGVIRITRVEVRRFADVPDEFALAEGEGDLTGDDFRRSHRPFWEAGGYAVTDDTLVVLLSFDLESG